MKFLRTIIYLIKHNIQIYENKPKILKSDCIYTGQDCENDTDGCAASPCAQGRTCVDISAEDEAVLGRGYNCSDCPAGYNLDDEKCEGNKKSKYFHVFFYQYSCRMLK